MKPTRSLLRIEQIEDRLLPSSFNALSFDQGARAMANPGTDSALIRPDDASPAAWQISLGATPAAGVASNPMGSARDNLGGGTFYQPTADVFASPFASSEFITVVVVLIPENFEVVSPTWMTAPSSSYSQTEQFAPGNSTLPPQVEASDALGASIAAKSSPLAPTQGPPQGSGANAQFLPVSSTQQSYVGQTSTTGANQPTITPVLAGVNQLAFAQSGAPAIVVYPWTTSVNPDLAPGLGTFRNQGTPDRATPPTTSLPPSSTEPATPPSEIPTPAEVTPPPTPPVSRLLGLDEAVLDARVSQILAGLSGLGADWSEGLDQHEPYAWLAAAGLLTAGAGYAAWVNRKLQKQAASQLGRASIGLWEGEEHAARNQ